MLNPPKQHQYTGLFVSIEKCIQRHLNVFP